MVGRENNKKRISYRGKVPVISSRPSFSKLSSAASPTQKVLSDTTKIILERRIGELRTQIVSTLRKGNHIKASQLHSELTAHQTALGFTPDDPPTKPEARKEESHDSTAASWSLPEEVMRTFNGFAARWDGNQEVKVSKFAGQVRGIPAKRWSITASDEEGTALPSRGPSSIRMNPPSA